MKGIYKTPLCKVIEINIESVLTTGSPTITGANADSKDPVLSPRRLGIFDDEEDEYDW